MHLEEKPANGTLQLNTDGSFTYVPNKGFVGQDTFVYFVSQGRQGDGPFVAVINVVDGGEVVQPAEPEVEAPSYAVTIALSSAMGACWDDWMPWQNGPGSQHLGCLYPQARREAT